LAQPKQIPPFDVRKGWKLYELPAFGKQLADLRREVSDIQKRIPTEADNHPKTKLLKRILEIILDEIPSDPTAKIYRQGTTLGSAHKDWSRAKFLGRFRLFFRFSTTQRIIIYCWINDENTLRKEGSKSDPYKVFQKMLDAGDPPSSWADLVEKATIEKPKHPTAPSSR
jgi:toxin YhaV